MVEDTANDEEIQKDVRRALIWDNRVQPSDVAATVRRGMVTLTGGASSLFKRWAAEQAAASVPGVTGVLNQIEVRLPITDERSDLDLIAAVARALAREPELSARGIRANVTRAQITLEGEVERPEEKTAAARIACQVFGARGVVNALEVRPLAGAEGRASIH